MALCRRSDRVGFLDEVVAVAAFVSVVTGVLCETVTECCLFGAAAVGAGV